MSDILRVNYVSTSCVLVYRVVTDYLHCIAFKCSATYDLHVILCHCLLSLRSWLFNPLTARTNNRFRLNYGVRDLNGFALH